MIKPKEKLGINALDIIIKKEENGKKITMIGFFPRTQEIRLVAKELWILEQDPYLLNPSHGIILGTSAEYVIPKTNILVITGSSLINKSIERLLKISRSKNAHTIILGPSTPLCDVLFSYGVNMIAGAEVTDPDAILKKISQSRGMLSTKMCKNEIQFRVMER